MNRIEMQTCPKSTTPDNLTGYTLNDARRKVGDSRTQKPRCESHSHIANDALPIFAVTCQRSDVVDKALNQIFVPIRLVMQNQIYLLTNGSRRDFDFELVFFLTLVSDLLQASQLDQNIMRMAFHPGGLTSVGLTWVRSI